MFSAFHMSIPRNAPARVITDLSHKHFANVWNVLNKRESARREARDASCEADSVQAAGLRGLVAHYSVAVGNQDDNKSMNRYGDVEPYDRTLIVVQQPTGKPLDNDLEKWYGRYLNANWVLERFGHKWWIATQAPLRHTTHAFLSVILHPIIQPPTSLISGSTASPSYLTEHSRVRTVVQLTRDVEGGRKKADAYFPSEIGQSLIVSPEQGCPAPALKVTLVSSKTIDDAHCIQSTISIAPVHRSHSTSTLDHGQGSQGEGEEIFFQHMLYTSWPDHGVPKPQDRASLLAFLRLVDQTNRSKSPDLDPDPPIIVGCSAGIGRTGSFIALSSLLRNDKFLPSAEHPTDASVLPPSPLGSLPDDVKDDLVAEEVDSLREQRPGMVQRPEQVTLIYEVLKDSLAKHPS